MKIILNTSKDNLKFLLRCCKLDKKFYPLRKQLKEAIKLSVKDTHDLSIIFINNLEPESKKYANILINKLKWNPTQVTDAINYQLDKLKGLINKETALFIVLKENGLEPIDKII